MSTFRDRDVVGSLSSEIYVNAVASLSSEIYEVEIGSLISEM